MFDKEQMSYQLAGRSTGMRGAVCLTHGPNSLLCVPGRAPILQHSFLSMYAQLIIAKTVNEPDSEKPKKILEIIVRMVPQATKHEEQISYNDTANRVSQLQSQILKDGEVGESQEEELAKLIGCAIFSRSNDDASGRAYSGGEQRSSHLNMTDLGEQLICLIRAPYPLP